MITIKNQICLIVAIAVVFHAVNCLAQPSPINFTRYDIASDVQHQARIRLEHIVINKADATDAGLQQLGRQLYALSSSDTASSINIYTSVWAAKATVGGTTLENLSLADQLRYGKAWVGTFRKRGTTNTLEYALGGMFKGAGNDMEPQDVKTLQFP
jgi:hypothetical protein